MNFIEGLRGACDCTAGRIRRNDRVLHGGGKKGVVATCLDRYKIFHRLIVLPTFVLEGFGLRMFLLVNN